MSHSWGQGELWNYKLAERFLRVRKGGQQTMVHPVNFPETLVLESILRTGPRVRSEPDEARQLAKGSQKDRLPHTSDLNHLQSTPCSLPFSSSLAFSLCVSVFLSPSPPHPYPQACPVPIFSFLHTCLLSLLSLNKQLPHYPQSPWGTLSPEGQSSGDLHQVVRVLHSHLTATWEHLCY